MEEKIIHLGVKEISYTPRYDKKSGLLIPVAYVYLDNGAPVLTDTKTQDTRPVYLDVRQHDFLMLATRGKRVNLIVNVRVKIISETHWKGIAAIANFALFVAATEMKSNF